MNSSSKPSPSPSPNPNPSPKPKPNLKQGETLSAVEFLDHASMELVVEQQPSTRRPLQERCPFYMLLELS